MCYQLPRTLTQSATGVLVTHEEIMRWPGGCCSRFRLLNVVLANTPSRVMLIFMFSAKSEVSVPVSWMCPHAEVSSPPCLSPAPVFFVCFLLFEACRGKCCVQVSQQ